MMGSHPDTNPSQQGLTSVNFCHEIGDHAYYWTFVHTKVELITTAIRSLTCCEKEVEGNLEMINMSASMPILLDSGLSILLLTMSSQGAICVRLLPLHCNDLQYQNNIVLELHIS